MQKIIVFSLFLMTAKEIFSQQPVLNTILVQQDDKQKSKPYKKIANIFVLGGCGIMATAFIIPRGELVDEGFSVGPFNGDKYKNDGLKKNILISGAVAVIGSIPFFVAANRSSNRQKSVGLIKESALRLHHKSTVSTVFPAVSVRFNLH